MNLVHVLVDVKKDTDDQQDDTENGTEVYLLAHRLLL